MTDFKEIDVGGPLFALARRSSSWNQIVSEVFGIAFRESSFNTKFPKSRGTGIGGKPTGYPKPAYMVTTLSGGGTYHEADKQIIVARIVSCV